jgi:hypothetical protein
MVTLSRPGPVWRELSLERETLFERRWRARTEDRKCAGERRSIHTDKKRRN